MRKVPEDKRVLGSEHPFCDTVQLLMLILFFTVWVFDSFILNLSTVFAGVAPLPLRLCFASLSLGLGLYFAGQSHQAIFDQASEPPKLVDVGVYSRVRHPMYLGTLLFCLGFFLFTLSLLALMVWVLFLVFYDRMATYEEKDLVEILGEEYVRYQRRVPKWVPRFNPKNLGEAGEPGNPASAGQG